MGIFNKKTNAKKAIPIIKTEVTHRIYETCDKCPPIMSGLDKGKLGHCPNCNDTRKKMIAWIEKESN